MKRALCLLYLMVILVGGCSPVTNSPNEPSADPVGDSVSHEVSTTQTSAPPFDFLSELVAKCQPTVDGHFALAFVSDEEAMKAQGLVRKPFITAPYGIDAMLRDGLPVSLVAQDPKVQPTLSPDGRTIAVYYSGDHSLTLYDVASEKTVDIPMLKGKAGPVYNYWGAHRLWDKSGENLYFTGSPDGITHLFRVQKNGEGFEALYPDLEVVRLHGWSSDGSSVVDGGPNYGVLIISPDGTYKDTGNFAATDGVLSPSGKLMVTAPGMGQVIDVYDFETSQSTRLELPTPFDYTLAPLGWSPSEQRLAMFVNSQDLPATVLVVDLEAGDMRALPIPGGYNRSPGSAPSWVTDNTMLVSVLKQGKWIGDEEIIYVRILTGSAK